MALYVYGCGPYVFNRLNSNTNYSMYSFGQSAEYSLVVSHTQTVEQICSRILFCTENYKNKKK